MILGILQYSPTLVLAKLTYSKKQTAFKAELFDATGQLISIYQWQGDDYSIDLQKLASGTYLMRVSAQEDTATFKIQKTH